MKLRTVLINASLVSILSACSGGATVGSSDEVNNATSNEIVNEPTDGILSEPAPQTVSADNALSRAEATQAINDPINKANEPHAMDWVSSDNLVRQAQCVDGSQNAVDAFFTSFFLRASDDAGDYLVSSSGSNSQTPEYIEFCFNVVELGRYQFVAHVLAPSINEDSFYVTVNEDVPGTVPNPGIYDVSRSSVFKDNLIRTRTQAPLYSILEPGTVTLRLYFREPNTAIRSVRLESNGAGVPSSNPTVGGTTALAQCALNTGMSEGEIDSLIQQHLGDQLRRFVLTPADEERSEFTSRNDYQWLTDEGSANIMCLASPPESVDLRSTSNLIDNTIPAGRIVFGSQGRDEQRANTPLKGTFIGNGGNDKVGVLEDGGVFVGGEGDDELTSMLGGLFEGGPGDDKLRGSRAGTFIGGSGDDQVTTLSGGFFDGGEGFDSVERASDLATYTSVESVGIIFSELLPPANLKFEDTTQSSAVLTWDASADVRVDGYVISESRDEDIERIVDLGLSPLSVSRHQSLGTKIAIELFDTAERIFQVRAFSEVSSSRFLYSSPLEAQYIAPDLPAQSIIASREVLFDPTFNTYNRVELAEDGSVVRINDRSSTLFVNYGTRLESTTELVDDNLLKRRTFSGDTRQYVVSEQQSGNEGALLTAYTGDGLSVLWQQELAKQSRLGGLDECRKGVITQDDWLVCIIVDGYVRAFDPQGTLYSYPAVEVKTSFQVVGGGQGSLVSWLEQSRPQFVVMNLFNGEETALNTDLEDILPGKGDWFVNAIAVNGEQAIFAGAQEYDCPTSIIDCGEIGNTAQSFFLARISLSTGRVLQFQPIPVQSRPVPDRYFGLPPRFGKIINDTVVFAYDNFVSTYDLDTLEELDRREVLGLVQDVTEKQILTQTAIGEGNQRDGVGLFLIER